MSEQRDRFEALFSAPPYEWCVDKHCGRKSAWPGQYRIYHVQAAWDAYQAAVPEGWQMVPKEPTGEMIDEARDHHESHHYLPYSLYKAMLSAAPKPGDV